MTTEQCPNPDLHPPHDACAGLDGTEHERGHRLSVTCPSCSAPAGVPCEHADRAEAARLADVEWGTCALCHQPLARLTAPLDVLHPDPDHAAACPPLPNPETAWNAYAAAINTGLSPGHPGTDQWVPETPEQARARQLLGAGRRLASERDNLIAAGADPATLTIPLGPLCDGSCGEREPHGLHHEPLA